MKILMISIFSHHFFNWTLQLKEAHHEIYWLDLSDSDKNVEKIDFVQQSVNWKNKINYRGRYFLKRHIPVLADFIAKYNHRELTSVLSRKIKEINPDVIQSFEMHSACTSILDIMILYPNIKWIYSCWGNDIYYYLDDAERLKKMKKTFPYIDYMFADCERDFNLAYKLGFNGKFLGPFPGGGGYDFQSLSPLIQKFDRRNIILVKGYQHHYGRCNNILEVLLNLKNELKDYKIVVFGATPEVYEYISENEKFKEFENLIIRGRIGHGEILELMGASSIYIGNNISDGTPNTMLEAIIMGAFPIQSNPGGATGEIIVDGVNGLLIYEPENFEHIKSIIKKAINNKCLIQSGTIYNNKNLRPKLEREFIKEEVNQAYNLIEKEVKKSRL